MSGVRTKKTTRPVQADPVEQAPVVDKEEAQMEEIATYINDLTTTGSVTLADGTEVTIGKVSLSTMGTALMLMSKVRKAVASQNIDVATLSDPAAPAQDRAMIGLMLVGVIVSEAEQEIRTILQKLTNLPEDRIEHLSPEDCITVFSALYIRNVDFFSMALQRT